MCESNYITQWQSEKREEEKGKWVKTESQKKQTQVKWRRQDCVTKHRKLTDPTPHCYCHENKSLTPKSRQNDQLIVPQMFSSSWVFARHICPPHDVGLHWLHFGIWWRQHVQSWLENTSSPARFLFQRWAVPLSYWGCWGMSDCSVEETPLRVHATMVVSY